MVQVSLSTSTDFDGSLNALVEDQGTALTVRFDLDEPAPAGGLKVYIDSDTNQILNRLDLPGAIANPQFENLNLLATQTNVDNSGLAVQITEGSTFATVTLNVFDNDEPDTFLPETFDGLVETTLSLVAADQIAAEDQSAITNVSDYTIDPAAASSTVLFADDASQLPGASEPPVSSSPVVSFEAVPSTISEEGTAEERLLRLEFTVAGEIPEGGLVVLFENLFGITDQADSEADGAAFEGLGLAPPFDQENNIIGVRLLENQAAIQLPMINDLIEETTTFDFRLLEGDGYTLDPDQNSTLFTITDDNGGPGVGPTIGLSVSETSLAEGDTFTVNFAVDGTIPSGGIDVLVQSDESVAGPLGQFDLANLDALQLSGVSNLRPGDDRGQSFIATITEANASITLEVFDDILAEEPVEIPFTLANGELYEVDPAAESVTLTISDEPQPVGPTVGLSVDQTNLVEGGDSVTLTISVDGEIPSEGLQVLINDTASAGSGLRSLTEFDVGNIATTGIDGFPSPAEGDSGFFVTVTEPTATITLAALDDGADEDEAAEVFTFEIINGEAYEVDPAAGSITVNIADAADAGGGTAPIVSVTTTTPELTEELQPQLEITLTVEGEIPDDGQGVVVTFGGDGVEKLFAPRLLDERTQPVFDPPDGVVPIGFTGTEVILGLLVPEVTVTAGLFDDLVEEERDVLNFEILPGDGYDIGEGTVSIGVEDGPSATPGEGPTVSLSVTETELVEGDEFTVNITVDESTGAIPDGGLELFIDSGPTDIGEFIIFGEDGIDPETDLVGIDDFPLQGDRNGGFFVTVVEPEASIALTVFDDGPNEGSETLDFSLADGEIYEVNPDAQNVTITIEDGGEEAEYSVESGVTSVFLDFALLEQAAGITLVGADSDATPEDRPGFLPPFQVGFEITEDTDFSFAPVGFVPVGGSIEHDGNITLGIGGAEVTVGEFSIGYDPARASDVASGFFVADTLDDALGLEVLFDLGIPATAAVSGIDGDDLNLGDADLLLAPEVANALGNADLAGADVGDARVDALVEVVGDGDLPVVSFNILEDVVAEDSDNPSFTFTITTEGEIPEEGITTVWGGDFLDQPPVFDNNIPVLFLPDGSLEFGSPIFDDEGNLTGFTATVFENLVTANPFIFDDIIEEEPLTLVYTLLPGEGYTVGQADATITVVDGPSVIPGSGPVVSLSVSDSDLEEGDEFTVFFDVEGDIPEGGLEVFVASGPTDVGEFNIFGENGIDPATDLVGFAGFPEQGGAEGGFFATLVENQASITLSVFEDGPNEGTETLTFELADGEIYEVGPDAGVVTLTISDVGTIGTDEAETLVGDDTDDAIGGLAGDDTIAGGAGNDIILGGDGDDILRGAENSRNPQDGTDGGNDIIFGGAGNDRIGGKSGNDILSGDDGDDTIYGDDGDDILMGVTGNDILIGDNFSDGSGSDLFVFGSGDGTDTVLDFEVGIDRIGIVEGEFTFADVTLTQDGVNTVLGVSTTGETLAVLNNIQASALGESDFVTVPDVSNIDEALALI